MPQVLLRISLTACVLFALTPSLLSDIKIPKILSNHMVLQRGSTPAIWGTADAGETVTVSFQGQNVSTNAGPDGRFLVRFAPIQAGGPFDLQLSGKNKLMISDVLIGEVWVCSGQSNMEWPVSKADRPEQEMSEAHFDKIRIFAVKHEVSSKIKEDFEGEWTAVSPESIRDFSAVGYFFGRELYRRLAVPIGLINSSWGGTPAEAWTSEQTLSTDLSLNPLLWNWKRVLSEYPGAKSRYEGQLKDWEQADAVARTEGKTPPPKPGEPRGPGDSWTPSGLYNAMIAPMASFAIRGAIWYQGESNAQPYRSVEYQRLFQAMINDWRSAWNQGPFPFLFVQLANFRERKADPDESAWAELREAQTMALSLPNTAMASAIDIGQADDIHPTNKQEVGRRLALGALRVAYGEKIVHSGPIYRGMILNGSEITIQFSDIGQGLAAKGAGKLEGFAIAGRDRHFVWAEAKIKGDTVVVSSSSVRDPVAVRYGWADNPACNLINREGLPASPFRTDDWPGSRETLVATH